jgi:NADH:ubiquinone oxidoreductase subunit 2 (subunit N)
VSAYFYLRPVAAMYMQEPVRAGNPGASGGEEGEEEEEMDWGAAAAAGVVVGVVLFIGIFPSSALDLATRVAVGLVSR